MRRDPTCLVVRPEESEGFARVEYLVGADNQLIVAPFDQLRCRSALAQRVAHYEMLVARATVPSDLNTETIGSTSTLDALGHVLIGIFDLTEPPSSGKAAKHDRVPPDSIQAGDEPLNLLKIPIVTMGKVAPDLPAQAHGVGGDHDRRPYPVLSL